MLGDKILSFFKTLSLNVALPDGVEVMNPYQDDYTFSLCEKFYSKYYPDNSPRSLILGINPGRLGGGSTGIAFTDPKKLAEICGIENTLPKKAELSADFIHRMIAEYGGVKKFFGNFYFSSVCPLGFTLNGKNLNYYDIPALQKAVTPFCVDSIKKQIELGMNQEVAYCLGEGKNFDFLTRLNREHSFFGEIIPLSHPRFIMQYRRKKLEEYIQSYLEALERRKR